MNRKQRLDEQHQEQVVPDATVVYGASRWLAWVWDASWWTITLLGFGVPTKCMELAVKDQQDLPNTATNHCWFSSATAT